MSPTIIVNATALDLLRKSDALALAREELGRAMAEVIDGMVYYEGYPRPSFFGSLVELAEEYLEGHDE